MSGGHYYNPRMVQIIQENIKTDKKAAGYAKKILDEAEKHLSLGNDFWWNFVTNNSLPRGAMPGERNSGCPECGDAFLNKYGVYGWVCLTENNRWKIQCPHCGSLFPSNDFKKYYESGLDEFGFFREDLADRSLLVNELYPQYGPDKYVDDGKGYIDENGHSWAFIAYYHHWGVWYGEQDRSKNQTGSIQNAIRHLAYAWVFTSDVRYAVTGLLLLYRISKVYPDMDLNVWMRGKGRPYRNSDGHSLQGKVVGCIWETFLSETLCEACDALLPAFEKYPKEIEEAFLGFEAADVRKIEASILDGIVRQVYPGLQKAAILGNEGMHQCALAMAAVCMGKCEEADEWIEYLFRNGKRIIKEDPVKRLTASLTGGNIFGILENKVDRDGLGGECSLGYNSLWLRQLARLADILSYYPGIEESEYNIYRHPKMQMMLRSYIPLVIDDRYVPNTGDNASTGAPGLILKSDEDLYMLMNGYRITKDPRILEYIQKVWPDAQTGEFENPRITGKEEMITLLRQNMKSSQSSYTRSDLLCGYGNCILRQPYKGGNFANLYFGRTVGHGHWDKLNMELYYKGIDISPDLGYPSYCEAGFYDVPEWNNHTLSHNCVLVNDKCQKTTYDPGVVKGFEDDAVVKNIDVDAPNVYDETDMFNRSLTMIEISPGKAYYVDFFRVSGGESHRFSLHGGEGSLDVNLGNQVKWFETAAGEGISYGENPDRGKSHGSGLSYIYNAECSTVPNGIVEAVWNVKDTWNVSQGKIDSVAFKAWLMGPFDEVTKGKGVPPQNKPGNPKFLYYLLGLRKGPGLKSLFTSVYEAYDDASSLTKPQPVVVEVKDENKKKDASFLFGAVKVPHKDGITDYVFSSISEDTEVLIDERIRFKGRLGFLRIKEGKVVYAFLSKGTLLEYKEGDYRYTLTSPLGCAKGKVTDFQKELNDNRFIDVEFDEKPANLQGLVNRYIHIRPSGPWNASYFIEGIEDLGNNRYRLVTNRTFVKERNEGGIYTYVFDVGADFEIPLAVSYGQE